MSVDILVRLRRRVRLRFRVQQGFDRQECLSCLNRKYWHGTARCFGVNLRAIRAFRVVFVFVPEVSRFRKAFWCLSFRRSFVTMHGN
jgi:hypothetical protein